MVPDDPHGKRGEAHDPHFFRQLRLELSDGWRWFDRAIVLAYGVLAGLLVVTFTFLSKLAYAVFSGVNQHLPWMMLIWTPLLTAGLVWVTPPRRRTVILPMALYRPKVRAARKE